MSESIQVVAYEGGELRALGAGSVPGEAVLALPLSRLLVKMIRVPAEADPVATALPLLSALSPFPDEPLTVSCETVRETEKGTVVLAAALPESAADDIAEALDAAKLTVTRIDALVLGELRGLWSQLDDGRTGIRRLVLMKSPECLTLIVLDDDQPLAIRALTSENELRREIMLSLLEAEDFGGAKELAEIVVEGEAAVDGLETFAPIRRVTLAGDLTSVALAGVAERAVDPAALDVLPASWREVLQETRFKAKLIKYLAIAGGVWVLAMTVLFGVPMVYDFLTDHQKTLSKEHAKQYKAVLATKEKVNLVRKYSDHDRGALEVMREISARLPLPAGASPSCIELSNWNFKREEGLRISGEADSANLVYQFKEAVIASKLFATVDLQGPSAAKGGRHRFDLDCRFEAGEGGE